jgi:hypothetical protein
MSGPANRPDDFSPVAPGGPLTPQALIDTYCQPGMQSEWRSRRRRGSMFNAGYCSYDGHHGFYNGTEWLVELAASGWQPLPELGDWPLVVFMLWQARASDPRWAIAHYCKGDMAVEVFDDKQAASDGLKRLRSEQLD